MSKPICGIYKITNQINGKCYIGQSVNIAKRWAEHRCKATSKGSEGFESHFYRSIRKYGLENFSFEILEECLREELNKKEGIIKAVATAEHVAELYSEGIIAIRDNAVVVLLHRF